MNAVAGRRPETYSLEPFRFDQMRPGCYDVEARVRDMDINGVWASVNFPSQITGFCGRVFFDAPDRDSGTRLHPRVERLALRGVVLAAPGPDRAVGHHVPGGPRTGGARRSGATPTAGSRRSPFPSGPHAIGLPVALGARPLGSDHRGRASRRTRSSHCTSAARASRSARPAVRRPPDRSDAVRPAVPHGLRGVVVVRVSSAAPGPQDRDERRRDRLGGDAASTASTTWSIARATARAGPCARRRCCVGTSGSARSTIRRRSTPGTPSGSRTSWSRWTIRTATEPGPTPSTSSSRLLGSHPDR